MTEAQTGSSVLARAAVLLRRAAREPMIVFAVIGLALFAAVAATDLGRDKVIRLSRADVAQIVAYWEAQTQRRPTEQELRALLDERVNEEVLYREALRLGLERDDVIVRRRLAQKAAFLHEDVSPVAPPSEAVLRRYFTEHAERYAEPDRLSFEQVYLSPDQRGARLEASIADALGRLQGGEGDDPARLGDPFMLPLRYEDVRIDQLAGDYGRAFAEAMRAAPVGAWDGPIESALGIHLVRVTRRIGSVAPAFEAVRARVLEDYVADQRRAQNTAWLARLRGGYRVEIDSAGLAP